MSERPSVTVSIRGKEFRVLSTDEEGTLQRVASYLDETMSIVETRTGTVDSLDLALLTALNLAREIIDYREGRGSQPAGVGVDTERLRSLIELAESALQPESAAP